MNKEIDMRYIKAIIFAIALIFAVMYFKPDVKESATPESTVVADNSVQTQDLGDTSDNYVANATDGKSQIQKWNKKYITVYIDNNPTYIDAVRDAFSSYNDRLSGFIKFGIVNEKSRADIFVHFTPIIELSDPAAQQKIAGLTSTTTSGNDIESVKIQLLTNMNGQPVTKEQMYHVALHEIGHALGINGHSQDPNDIMYYSTTNAMTLSNRDVATIKLLYSGKAIETESQGATVNSEKLREAIEYTQNVPNKTISWINLAEVYYDAKMLPEALEAYKKALSIDANDANVYAGMARCYFQSKKFTTAAQFYQYAMERSHDNSDTDKLQYMKGLSYINAEDYSGAFNELSSLIYKYPNDKDYVKAFVFACAKGNRIEGKSVLKTYIQNNPQDREDEDLAQYLKFYNL